MEITDFFDPYNIDHIQAYKILQETGFWPKGFLPKNIKMVTAWHIILATKCANAWIEQALAGHILGIPTL